MRKSCICKVLRFNWRRFRDAHYAVSVRRVSMSHICHLRTSFLSVGDWSCCLEIELSLDVTLLSPEAMAKLRQWQTVRGSMPAFTATPPISRASFSFHPFT
jgi:hypothetical protein